MNNLKSKSKKTQPKAKNECENSNKKYIFSFAFLLAGLLLSYAVIFHLCDGNVFQKQIADLGKTINLMNVIWYFCLAILAILSFVFSFILFRKKDLPKIALASFVIIATLSLVASFIPTYIARTFTVGDTMAEELIRRTYNSDSNFSPDSEYAQEELKNVINYAFNLEYYNALIRSLSSSFVTVLATLICVKLLKKK